MGTLATWIRRERDPPSGAVDLLQRTKHDDLGLALLRILDVFIVLLVHLRVGCRESRVDILRHQLVLGGLAFLDSSDVSLLNRSVLVERSADKISGIRQVREVRSLNVHGFGFRVLVVAVAPVSRPWRFTTGAGGIHRGRRARSVGLELIGRKVIIQVVHGSSCSRTAGRSPPFVLAVFAIRVGNCKAFLVIRVETVVRIVFLGLVDIIFILVLVIIVISRIVIILVVQVIFILFLKCLLIDLLAKLTDNVLLLKSVGDC
jgi:hypothetical protein